jgi:hypothetical protein
VSLFNTAALRNVPAPGCVSVLALLAAVGRGRRRV